MAKAPTPITRPTSAVQDRPCVLVMLAKVENYTLLRRQLGVARALTVADALLTKIGAAWPGARVTARGSDEVELLFDCRSRDGARELMTAIHRLFDEPVLLDGAPYSIHLIVAGAVADQPFQDEVRLLEEAEQALDEASRDRPPVLRDVSRFASDTDRLTLTDDLQRAIVDHELFLQYQPKIHVRQHSVTGVEALIRWRHPDRGLILPADFIPAAERSAAIGAVTLWTIRQAITDQRLMRKHGHDLRIFVNIAGTLLGNAAFIQEACELVCSNDAKLGFEVTETSVIRDPQIAIDHLMRVADVGITVSIDDYGAGLSSLAYLKRLPARELKIDKLFITQLTSSNRDPLIVRSTIDLAHALEMDVVAEGVETPAALALLSVMGCDMVQGYLISRPLGLDVLLDFLGEQHYREVTKAGRASFHGLSAAWKRG